MLLAMLLLAACMFAGEVRRKEKEAAKISMGCGSGGDRGQEREGRAGMLQESGVGEGWSVVLERKAKAEGVGQSGQCALGVLAVALLSTAAPLSPLSHPSHPRPLRPNLRPLLRLPSLPFWYTPTHHTHPRSLGASLAPNTRLALSTGPI